MTQCVTKKSVYINQNKSSKTDTKVNKRELLQKTV